MPFLDLESQKSTKKEKEDNTLGVVWMCVRMYVCMYYVYVLCGVPCSVVKCVKVRDLCGEKCDWWI